ncbi:midkine-like isoform X2 [Mastomys coucha]|uniref:midkine-like isoform X2 n=1 Tax=Mastomys coucha TaxID=35658 RepID=UPI001261F691|nr:midkine-like isoform X2 [Mastomys coucha]
MQHRGFFLLSLLVLLVVTSAVAKREADCKYKFESWGACDGSTANQSPARQGTLKKARYSAQCQETKPCTYKTKSKTKAKKRKGKD